MCSQEKGWSLRAWAPRSFIAVTTQCLRRSWYALSWIQYHLLLSEGCLSSTCWCVIIYIFILGNPFLCSFTCIILVRQYMLCSGIFSCLLGKTSLELLKCRKWREMVKVGHRKARPGAERPEFTLQGWHHCHSSWTSKPDPSQDWVFYVYICQEINTCWISHLLTVSSLVMGLSIRVQPWLPSYQTVVLWTLQCEVCSG